MPTCETCMYARRLGQRLCTYAAIALASVSERISNDIIFVQIYIAGHL